jgi:hypothetical protein
MPLKRFLAYLPGLALALTRLFSLTWFDLAPLVCLIHLRRRMEVMRAWHLLCRLRAVG